jgi:calcineurin-like phosphoesterase family protein
MKDGRKKMIKTLYPKFQSWSATGSVYIISDTHFDDSDCKLMDPNWISPEDHMAIIKADVRKTDTLIHLGDVGDASYLDELKCHKVLITGNHDVLSKVASHFDEVYTGPLFIADRILLSHEPIIGLEDFCWNIHGHDHASSFRKHHTNLASNVCKYQLFNLGAEIKGGLLSQIENYHRITINLASERKNKNERP